MNATRISSILAVIAFIALCYKFACDTNKHSLCYYRVALIAKDFTAYINLIDTVKDRGGVGVYAYNENVHESYQFISDSLIKYARVGDSVYKPANSRYGWLVKWDGNRHWLPFLDEYRQCDSLTVDQMKKIMRNEPVSFHDSRY